MVRGDHVKVVCEWKGVPYWHHGIDVGHGRVVSINPTGVLMQSVAVFSEGRPVVKVAHPSGSLPFSAEEISARAFWSFMDQRVGGPGTKPGAVKYDVVLWNCEHFAVYCCTGVRLSRQVARAGRGLLAAGAAAYFLTPAGVVGLAMAAVGTAVADLGGGRHQSWAELVWFSGP